MMRTLFGWSIFAVVAAPAFAQPREGEIVVTGERTTKDEVRDEAKGFIRQVSAIPIDGQFARWKVPICVKVSGIGEATAKLVADRIVAIATEAGIKVGKPGCKANLSIAFAYDANLVIKNVLKNNSRSFRTTPLHEKTKIYPSNLPVRWWYQTDVEGGNGQSISGGSAALLGAQVEGAAGGLGINSNDGARYGDSYSSSLIGTYAKVKIESANVVVDTTRAEGKPLSAVASYIAMVTLARVKLGAAASDERSILSLFSPANAAPIDVSANDRAFLAALYKVPMNRSAKVQEAAIIAEMTRTLTGG